MSWSDAPSLPIRLVTVLAPPAEATRGPARRMRVLSRLHHTVATMAAAAVVMVGGCTSTTAGVAVKAPDRADVDGAVIALMDTGVYSVTPSRPPGNAGNDRGAQAILEAQRMAIDVSGPWQLDAELHHRPGLLQTLVTAPSLSAGGMAEQNLFAPEVADVAGAHGFITGFSSMRVSGPADPGQRALINSVLRFPDDAAAQAAATEMAGRTPVDAPDHPLSLRDYPDAVVRALDYPDASTTVFSFAAHGPYVLYQWAHTAGNGLFMHADQLVSGMLGAESRLIDRFVPTDQDKLAELPKDPSGELFAKTLVGPDNKAPVIVGVWDPAAWVHFEDNPLSATALFRQAGVDAVGQRLTTVYETRTADGAARVADSLATETAGASDIEPIDGIRGLPTAKCFSRTRDNLPPDATMSLVRIHWHYKCVGRAGRYAFTAVSDHPDDVKQQMAAQYRILVGK